MTIMYRPVLLIPIEYPIQPIQLTLISSLTIGLPAFLLTLEPNQDRIQGSFLRTVLTRAIPGAAAVCIFLALLVALGMFGIHAVVPDLLKKGIQGLIGYGFWMVAFVLLWAAGLLLSRRDRRQTLRLWCLGLLPVVGGALLHILLWRGA